MSPDYSEKLKHIKPEKKEVKISEKDKAILEKFSRKEEAELTLEQRTVLDIVSKRKTVKMIMREYNLALKPLGKELYTDEEILKLLKDLQNQNLVKAVTGGDGQEYWVDLNYYREKLLGTDKL